MLHPQAHVAGLNLVALARPAAERVEDQACERPRFAGVELGAHGLVEVVDRHRPCHANRSLVHASITLGLAERKLERDNEAAKALIAEAVGHAQAANDALRELAHGILPVDLARGGLRGGIDAVVERLDLAVTVDLPRERFPTEIEASAYFVVAEALTNIVKHAHAESAAVSAVIDAGMLRVQVRDDGMGGAEPDGPGLVGLSDRVTALGGRFSVESPAGGGTVLTATLPISAVPADAG